MQHQVGGFSGSSLVHTWLIEEHISTICTKAPSSFLERMVQCQILSFGCDGDCRWPFGSSPKVTRRYQRSEPSRVQHFLVGRTPVIRSACRSLFLEGHSLQVLTSLKKALKWMAWMAWPRFRRFLQHLHTKIGGVHSRVQ